MQLGLCLIFFFQTLPWTRKQSKADKCPRSTSNFSPFYPLLKCRLMKGITPKIRMLCFVLIVGVLLTVSCVWIYVSFVPPVTIWWSICLTCAVCSFWHFENTQSSSGCFPTFCVEIDVWLRHWKTSCYFFILFFSLSLSLSLSLIFLLLHVSSQEQYSVHE